MGLDWKERLPRPAPIEGKLRFVSMNLCCLPPGLRNNDLPYFTTSSGVLLFVLLFVPSVLISFLVGNWKIGVGLFLPLLLLVYRVSHVFACEFARCRGIVLECLDPSHSDRKKDRLLSACHFIKDYDVVVVQELFDTRVMNRAAHVDHFIDLARTVAGFQHVVRPSGAYLPSVTMNMGLLILSRFPIVCSDELKFSEQFLGDKFAVNRGCLHARLAVPVRSPASFSSHILQQQSPDVPVAVCLPDAASASAQHTLLVDVFTCHISPCMDTLTGAGADAKGLGAVYSRWLVGLGEETRSCQIRQYGRFIASRALASSRRDSVSVSELRPSGVVRLCDEPEGRSLVVSIGDYNADIKHVKQADGTSTFKVGPAMEAVRTEMRKLGLVDVFEGCWKPTFGYPGRENLLTNVDSRQKSITEDLGWADEWTAAHCAARAVSMEINKGGEKDGRGGTSYVSFDEIKKAKMKKADDLTHISDHWALELIVTDEQSTSESEGAKKATTENSKTGSDGGILETKSTVAAPLEIETLATSDAAPK